MNVVGKVGSLISQGVYSVATPFHPFGGAVDVIVVQQQDGTFRSTPWYVRFGKFQGVLKGAEKVVRISVNGVESDFHMYLDNSGEAYFVKEVDEEKGVNLDQDSSKKSGGFLSNGHHVLDHSISDSGVLRLKGEVSSSVVPRIQRTESDGRYYDFHDSFDDSVDLSDYGSNSYETLEGENSVDSKGPQPEMVLVSVDGHILTAPISESEQNEENVQLRNPQFHLGPAEETDICEGNEEFSSGETAWAADYITQLEVSADDVQSIRRDTNGNDITSTAPLEVCQTEEVSICQSRETLVVEIQDRLTITDSEGVVASGLKKESVFKSCLELQDFGPQTGSPDLQGSGSLLKVKNSSDESNASSPVVDENAREIVIQSDASSPVVDENKQESVEKSQNIDGLSSTISPTSSGGHKSPKSESRLQDQEVEKEASGEVDSASSSPSVIDDTERNNEQVRMSVSNGGEDDSRQTTSLEDISKNASEVVEPQTESSSKGDKIHSGLGFEISLCGHELKAGMGLEAAAGVFEAHRVSEEYFTNSAPSIIKNQNLVIKFQEMYLTWEKAAPLVLGKAVFGSNLPVERKDAIPVELDQRSPTSGRRWRLWPIPFRRVKTLEHTYSNVSTEEVFLDSESGALVEPTPTSSSEGSPRKQFVRTNVPTNEQIASLNLKDGQNTVTFSFSTRVLGTQQVDAHIYLWKWNARIVISDVDGTITKSDVLGQFMPLVGKDWTQSGVARLFSAIKENGYQLLFLSARAIVQAYLTRNFLLNLKQDGKTLPNGPVVISPDGLFPSLFREVIRRAPHEFKIACLEDIKKLFPSDYNPFYAGFGNRDTDELSYRKIGIPKGKIFIINPKGEVAISQRIGAKSYTSLHTLVNDMFPPTSMVEQEDYNAWNYWRMPLPDID
ncbi:phosphatidate phosphatase PAH1-like [Vicia villosa]|uniref:phosphatidate phosphatase PAH1-like n=1 Tax=Vicia villosa TaxID=3911 RepID=UPI00273AE57A|nr:phosphatidate phosphatase PAH1-like [Vicia villosa]XP_058761979.1 phosphatidate phosphatase PAH1-like [Vicia villosa]XP_058761980.1 phosphatidate phosphatase PAH1-like [Vicia villosa]